MNRPATRPHIPQPRAAAVAELRRILCTAPAQGAWGTCRTTVENVRAHRNRAPETILTLLDANGRVQEFVTALLQLLAPTAPSLSLTDALLHETAVECRENALEARVLAGDRSGPTLATLRRELRAHRAALELAEASLDAEHLRKLAA